MLEAKQYTFGELIEAIQKESLDYEPVLGVNVEKDNSSNNVKAVKDIIKQTEAYNDVKQEKRSTNPEQIVDFNKTTLDSKFAYEPSKEYKDRVKAQVHGFPSVQNEKDSEIEENESLDFDGNKNFYDTNKKAHEEVADKEADIEHAGLVSHNLPKEKKNKDTFTNEHKTMKRLKYNKEFLNEAHVLKKVPDDYKVDGNKFMMEDINGMEYIIECKKDECVDYIHTTIVKVIDTRIDEKIKRMNDLSGYKSKDYFVSTTCESRKVENSLLSENLEKVKQLCGIVKK